MPHTQDPEYRNGLIMAVAAYTMWGIAPMYFKLLEHLPATEILLHRMIWAFVFMFGLMLIGGGFRRVQAVLKQPKQLGILTITSLLIGGNWLLFIWAINNDHMLDASLGYFINPLLNVLLAMVFLGERLRKLQWFAVALAATGVLIQLISFGSLPLVSLALAASFGIYGLLRKKVNIDARSGLLVETALMLPFALLALFWLPENLQPATDHQIHTWALLAFAGLVTSLPLLCFSGAAIRIPFTLLGFLQYIGPSLMFLLAVTVYHEPFELEKGSTFVFIWIALVIFTIDLLKQRKKKR